MKKQFLCSALLILVPTLLWAGKYDNVRMPTTPVPVLRGDEISSQPVAYPPYNIPYGPYDQIIGDTLVIGTTWYENQHNGTIGRMLDISEDGYIHFSWMKAYQPEPPEGQRHVWYNALNLATGQLVWLDGTVVDASSRAGFTTLGAAYGGIGFPAFHQVTFDPNQNPHTAVAFDIGPHTGAFTAYEPSWLYDEYGTPRQIIWPHMMFSHDESVMHIVSTEQVANAGDPQREYYTPGVYDPLSYTISYPEPPDSAFRMLSWTMTIAGDVAASPVSDRVMFAWTFTLDDSFDVIGADLNQFNNDIKVLIDDDGQDFHFEDAFNITNFAPVDSSWLQYGDTVRANMDTLRAYTDLNVFFDLNDYAHVVFTTRAYFHIGETGSYSYYNASAIWHWTEQYPNEITMVHNAFDEWWDEYGMFNNVDPGAWNVKAQRPQLAQDPETGDLYCMYQVYDCDTTHLSAFIGASSWGMPSGEIYMSKSTDGGINWSQGIDITNTISPNQAQPGQCLSELTPSLCKVTTDVAHILYVLDRDAGNVIQTEGSSTLNDVIYHTVPLSEIPSSPTVPQWPEEGSFPFHVELWEPVGIPGAGHLAQPKQFDLRQNYPNPFNPLTSITFSLDQVSAVSLDVYNLKGEKVANLASGMYGTGEHTVQFDGSALASGLYLYRLKADQRTLERKMLLLK